jgi:hypothetical protein
MFLNFKSNTKALYKIPFLRINFYDNPYLLKNNNDFDLYSLKLPMHIYVEDDRKKIHIYSLSKDLKNTEDTLRCEVKQYLPYIKNLLNKYTINNQNVILNEDSLAWFIDNTTSIKKHHLPSFIYPIQEKREQHMVTKSKYDIKTLIKIEDMDYTINGIWKKIPL